MSDEPRNGRPLSRRERRQQAEAAVSPDDTTPASDDADEQGAEAPDESAARPAADEPTAVVAPEPAGADESASPAAEATAEPVAPAGEETGESEEPAEPAPAAEPAEAVAADEAAAAGAADDGDADGAAATRRARTEQPVVAPTMPEGSSIEALLHRDPEPHKPRRGKGCLIAVIIVLALLGGIAAGGIWAWNTYGERVQDAIGLGGPHDYEEGEATGEALIRVEDGDTGEALSPRLYEAGVTLESDSFTRYLRENELNPTLYAGVYKLQKRMTSEAAVAALEDPANRQENAVQLPEGLTVEATLARVSEALDMPADDLQAAVADPSDYGVDADSLEGWLFPATYTFENETTATDVVKTMVERTRQSLAAADVPDDEVADVLTIASIIQREARFEEDFYKASRVIHNRLDPATWGDTNGLLQMDSTVQYGFGETHSGSASSSAEALADDNDWNTYKVVGLPKGPISNPGDLAIDAAMHPVDGPWLYFVTVNLSTGETRFTDSYAAHQKNVKEWVSWCADNPDAGC